jgi:hypothetical protein
MPPSHLHDLPALHGGGRWRTEMDAWSCGRISCCAEFIHEGQVRRHDSWPPEVTPDCSVRMAPQFHLSPGLSTDGEHLRSQRGAPRWRRPKWRSPWHCWRTCFEASLQLQWRRTSLCFLSCIWGLFFCRNQGPHCYFSIFRVLCVKIPDTWYCWWGLWASSPFKKKRKKKTLHTP